MRQALTLTAPGSPAHAYLTHQANLSEAALDEGWSYADETVDDLGDGSFRACNDPADETTCDTFANLKVNAAKLLVDLTVNGQPVGPRLAVGDGQSVRSGGSAFTFLTAYKTISTGALYVTVKIQTGPKPVTLNTYSATYRSPDGKQRETSTVIGPTEVAADSNVVVAMAFPGVAPGGRVTLGGDKGDYTARFTAVLKVG